MPYGLSAQETARIQHVLARFSSIEAAVVYGSRALGTYRQGSDIDLALKGDISFDCAGAVMLALDDLMLPYIFDITRYATLPHGALKEHIDRVGQVLYQA